MVEIGYVRIRAKANRGPSSIHRADTSFEGSGQVALFMTTEWDGTCANVFVTLKLSIQAFTNIVKLTDL